MSVTQYYTATTLDGFIADPDDSLEWLFTRDQDHDGPLNYRAFIADVGALAMGSTTYEWVFEHEFAGKDPSEWKWPYDIPCWVFTHRGLPVPTSAARAVRGGLGPLALILDDGTLIYSLPAAGPLSDRAYVMPGTLRAELPDLLAIRESLTPGLPVYFH